MRRSRLALAAMAVLLTACEPAAAGSNPSPGRMVRGFVVSKSGHGPGLVLRQANSTHNVLINDQTAWQRCALQEFYPTCKESK